MSWVVMLFFSQGLVCFTHCVYAQYPSDEWGFYHLREPLLSGHPKDNFHATGRQLPFAGIGDFSIGTGITLPQTLFHLYSCVDPLTFATKQYPAKLRLQTASKSHEFKTHHIPSMIEFRIGEIGQSNEEQLCIIKNSEYSRSKDVLIKEPIQRGLAIAVQKQGMLGTEEHGMQDVMSLYTQRRISSNGDSQWFPRIGIGNNQPLEMLHLGDRFTLHAGGASRIADNVYYDMQLQCDKKIVPGFSSSISMHQGVIMLSNDVSTRVNEPIDWSWGDPNTFNGIAIDHQFGMSIGKRYPSATLDIMSKSSQYNHAALTIQNNAYSTLLHLTSSGKLGIYNANPKERVHIGERLTIHAGGASMIADNMYVDTIPKAIQDGNSASLLFQQGTIQLATTGFTKKDAHCSYQLHPDNERTIRGLFIDSNQGNCGIGIKHPSARLEVLAECQNNATPAFSIATISNDHYVTVTNQGNVGIGLQFPEQALHVNGNVMIGTEWNDAPECLQEGHRLTVDGSIIAKEILVTIDNWADDVFESNYELISLDSLESFIKAHKHLPSIPSEKELQQQGINMATMNASMLRTIEELTLHVINLKNEIREMREILDILPIND